MFGLAFKALEIGEGITVLFLCIKAKDDGDGCPHNEEEEETGGDHEESIHTCLSERVFPFHVCI